MQYTEQQLRLAKEELQELKRNYDPNLFFKVIEQLRIKLNELAPDGVPGEKPDNGDLKNALSDFVNVAYTLLKIIEPNYGTECEETDEEVFGGMKDLQLIKKIYPKLSSMDELPVVPKSRNPVDLREQKFKDMADALIRKCIRRFPRNSFLMKNPPVLLTVVLKNFACPDEKFEVSYKRWYPGVVLPPRDIVLPHLPIYARRGISSTDEAQFFKTLEETATSVDLLKKMESTHCMKCESELFNYSNFVILNCFKHLYCDSCEEELSYNEW